MEATTVIDRDAALQCAGGNQELADELFGMLLKELPERRQAIVELYAAESFSELLPTVHTLNGSATYCGVPALKQAVTNLEHRLKAGRTDDIGPLVDAVTHEIDRVMASA